MAFNVREVTIHLTNQAPCMPASPDVNCPGGTCKPSKKKPGGGGKPGGGKGRNLAALRAQLRESLAPPV